MASSAEVRPASAAAAAGTGYDQLRPDADLTAQELARRRRERSEAVERITSKIHAGIWVALAVALCYYTKLASVVANSPDTVG